MRPPQSRGHPKGESRKNDREGVGSQAGLYQAAFPNHFCSSEITTLKLMPTHRPGQDSKKEVSLPTGLRAPAPWR